MVLLTLCLVTFLLTQHLQVKSIVFVETFFLMVHYIPLALNLTRKRLNLPSSLQDKMYALFLLCLRYWMKFK